MGAHKVQAAFHLFLQKLEQPIEGGAEIKRHGRLGQIRAPKVTREKNGEHQIHHLKNGLSGRQSDTAHGRMGVRKRALGAAICDPQSIDEFAQIKGRIFAFVRVSGRVGICGDNAQVDCVSTRWNGGFCGTQDRVPFFSKLKMALLGRVSRHHRSLRSQEATVPKKVRAFEVLVCTESTGCCTTSDGGF